MMMSTGGGASLSPFVSSTHMFTCSSDGCRLWLCFISVVPLVVDVEALMVCCAVVVECLDFFRLASSACRRREVAGSRAFERLQSSKRWPVAWMGMRMSVC